MSNISTADGQALSDPMVAVMGATDQHRADPCDHPATGSEPVVVSWGAGVDSTAMILELVERRERIDMVLLAEMPERPETLEFIPVFRQWMDAHGIPNETVRYRPKRFKNWPPYADLLENCLTNGTLPSVAFSRGACSAKWKVAPQDAWVKAWPVAQKAWARGEKVVRLIGFDSGPRDTRRYKNVADQTNSLFRYRYPLREWGRQRPDSEARIRRAGLPVPVASSCFFCTGMQCDEVRTLPQEYLRQIVLMEARAKPRLRNCEGLWRSSTKGLRGREARPGSMTRFIRDQRLLDPAEVDRIVAEAPSELVAFIDGASRLPLSQRPAMGSWLERFDAGALAKAA